MSQSCLISLHIRPVQRHARKIQIFYIFTTVFFVHAPRPLSRNFLQMAETLQKNLGHCHIEWHSNRVSRIGWKGGVLALSARCFLSDCLSVMSGPSVVIHMAAVSGCLTPRLDRYYPTIVLRNNQALALLTTRFCLHSNTGRNWVNNLILWMRTGRYTLFAV